MKFPWKFISNLTSRRRADETPPEEKPAEAAVVPQLPGPTADDVKDVATTEAIDITAAEVAAEPVDGGTTNTGQDNIEPEAINLKAPDEDHGLKSAQSLEPTSHEEVAVEAPEEPVKTTPAPPEIDVVEAPTSTNEAENVQHEPPTAPVANDLVLAGVQDTPVVRSPRKTAKREAVIPADQQFLMDMQAVETDIKRLKKALADKLKEQNAQLQSLIDRY